MAKKHCNTKTIPAVAYCRKSTNEVEAEKIISDQLACIRGLKPAIGKYQIVQTYTKDKGVPGWKRGAKRPDYFRMVNELKETKAKVILVDDIDRFPRADPMETVADGQSLREQGIRYIHAVNQGCKDLVEGGTIVSMQIAMDANASHEFCTRLSRRIATARRDAEKNGKRTGGRAPYRAIPKKRVEGYPLSGILVCDHCGNRMYGCTTRGHRVYRCTTNSSGRGNRKPACKDQVKN